MHTPVLFPSLLCFVVSLYLFLFNCLMKLALQFKKKKINANLGTYLGVIQNNCANYNLGILIIDYIHFFNLFFLY